MSDGECVGDARGSTSDRPCEFARAREQWKRTLEEILACGGQHEASTCPVEQRHADLALELSQRRR
ncbi:Uncharacterised protein [Mycobacteroides abscessus subsp. abscessus]|nr:Uncharacterised protein [Mycobacteroides abscessus subsp. abscessus]